MKKSPKSIPVNTEYGKPQFSLATADLITMPYEEAVKYLTDKKPTYYVKRNNKMPVPDM